MIDKYFKIEVLNQTPNPQLTIFAAMRQDYIEDFAYDRFGWGNDLFGTVQPVYCTDRKSGEQIDEGMAGDYVVKTLLKGDRGHYGPLEHPQITLNCGWFPHSTMQQLRTHRVGVSFDVQSMRYSGRRIIEAAEGKRDIEEVFYLRPVGTYSDRQGKRYEYTEEARSLDYCWCLEAAERYKRKIDQGFSEEHARGVIPFDVRQHWVVSMNLRSLLHVLDLRAKKDAQIECQQFCELAFMKLEDWAPEIAQWYYETRYGKAKLAP